ncbi:hypothetical protein P9D43_11310 [Neobacillus niacini]|uniref:DUF6544 family protein n=1 Tax=Neobacillus niacini TaxID=86668 RepID=UPI00052F8350|nr:DUF6544 family protein [Neobacillus niacini]KGM44801.1 hypothetical protein NP83_09505 [Neobacillus niacini]MEC1522600.1 hypothetical protein [Neobacillus niacini]
MPKSIQLVLALIILFLLLLIVVPRIARVLFVKNGENQVAALFEDIDKESSKTIGREDMKNLPYPVQRWLINSNVIGKDEVKTVRLKQQGRMRTEKNGKWMPTKAEQYFTINEPGFIWIADVKMAPLVRLSGIDTYKAGTGKMKIKVFSLFPVVDAKGPEMDSGTMMRYLAEMMWYPSAALKPYIKWEEIDETSAKATMENNGISVSGVFYFNEKGDILRFVGKRYREVEGKYVLSDWGGINKEFKEFKGIRIPSKSDVTWFEKDEEFRWFEVEITDIQYNVPSLY